VQNEMNNEWVTISEAIKIWRAAPGYDSLYRLVKRSGIETRRRGKYRNEPFIAFLLHASTSPLRC